MRRRKQASVAICLVDRKALRTAHSLQVRESTQWHLAGASDKLQERRALFSVEALERIPEPHNNLVTRAVLVVVRVCLQFRHIHVRQAADQELQFGRGEDTHQLRGHEVIEALQEGVDLRADGGGHAVVRDESDVVGLVLIRHQYVATVRNQIHDLSVSELLDLRGEGKVHHEQVQGSVEDLTQGLVVVRLSSFDVLEVHRHAQQVLVERSGEVRIQQLSITDRLANQPTHKLEVIQMVRVDHTERIRLEGRAIRRGGKQRIVRVEDLARKDDVPLAGQATGINAFLAVEVHLQPAAHLLGGAYAQLVEGVLEHLTTTDLQVHSAPGDALVGAFQLREKVLALVVKLQERTQLGDAHKRAERVV
mmetsp:Transcript_40760/g.70537  ORF Transcript_40760/g.70537 Transcript_40760/m.70537 type:complete len:364 (+) Transcript_40760:292-1383(+)